MQNGIKYSIRSERQDKSGQSWQNLPGLTGILCLRHICKRLIGCSKNWFGYRVFAVDGSTLEIPLSNDTSSEFGTITSCNNQDICWVEGLLSTIYDVFLDQIVDGQIYTKGTGERDPAREHWTRLHELNLAQNAHCSSLTVVIIQKNYTRIWFLMAVMF